MNFTPVYIGTHPVDLPQSYPINTNPVLPGVVDPVTHDVSTSDDTPTGHFINQQRYDTYKEKIGNFANDDGATCFQTTDTIGKEMTARMGTISGH
ncbi:unnamed protein product [Caenorhabditis auriculariae]|uniref:Uncharacterized protein n=1 Tax=Caenorhabditis auriculariae TaxID=2777116 RepID=A0A8S1HPE5_9PELO|nr:unnamed protein product [Caenorhabditis auriculariae]